MSLDNNMEHFEPFQIDEIQPDHVYTGEIVWSPVSEDSSECAILINGKILTAEQFSKLINRFEGWKIDIKFYE